MGGLSGEEKIEDLDGGIEEVVVNICFEGLERRMGLKRVWECIPEAGKKRNERVKVSRKSEDEQRVKVKGVAGGP